jgi:hypothetical protein
MTADAAVVYLVYAAEDAALAGSIAAELSSYGLGIGGLDSEIHERSDGLLRGASAVVVLCTPGGMRGRGLRRRAALALLHAQHHPAVLFLPVLLDRGADPTTMFGPYEWLAPASTAPADVAAAVVDEVFGRSPPSAYDDQLPPAEDLGRSAVGSHREALRVANQAITQTRMVRRVVWSAVIAVVVLTVVLAVLVLLNNQGGRAPLLIMVFPLIAFAAALATLRPTRRNL